MNEWLSLDLVKLEAMDEEQWLQNLSESLYLLGPQFFYL